MNPNVSLSEHLNIFYIYIVKRKKYNILGIEFHYNKLIRIKTLYSKKEALFYIEMYNMLFKDTKATEWSEAQKGWFEGPAVQPLFPT